MNFLNRPIRELPYLGKRYGPLAEKLVGPRVADLLYHLPVRQIRRQKIEIARSAEIGAEIIIPLTVIRHNRAPYHRKSLPYRVLCEDADLTPVTLVFFHQAARMIQSRLEAGKTYYICGRMEMYRDQYQITHPAHILSSPEEAQNYINESVYPATEGLSARILNKAVMKILPEIPELPEWIDPHLLKSRHWPGWREAMIALHQSGFNNLARDRLAYDELLADQIHLALLRREEKSHPGLKLPPRGTLIPKVRQKLPFRLTQGQEQALAEISGDMISGQRMMRLLQGDVGSGKTVVALLAMLQALENEYQAVLMAPTEILARQHLETLRNWLQGTGIHAVCLTGRDKGQPRKALLRHIREGEVQIVIGTHALFQEDVKFKNPGLIVIDEQHRFGVQQRLMLAEKGKNPHVLTMTATPIPRTLLMTAYGELDVSKITEKPAGRQPVDTRLISSERMEDLMASLPRFFAENQQAYWVCPLVEASEKIDLAAAEERYETLKTRFPEICIDLIHGKMKETEKDRRMEKFVSGETQLLVATTVIEVGVNVPNASLMIIEHAERFGLSQLHQLRGRVGRGSKASRCLLLYTPPLGATAQRRLEMMRETEDGFLIAETDFQLRGGGEVLGTRQSGLPGFRVANLEEDHGLLDLAHKDAVNFLSQPYTEAAHRTKAVKILMELFEKSASERYLLAG